MCGVLQEKCRTRIPGQAFCASSRSRNAHGHLRRAILRGSLQEKCRTRIPGQAFCASLRSQNAHGHLRRAILRGNLQEKCRTRIPGQAFLCEPAQSKRTWTFEKSHFAWKFTGKMPDGPATTSIKHWASTLTVRTPQCAHTVWGMKPISSDWILMQPAKKKSTTIFPVLDFCPAQAATSRTHVVFYKGWVPCSSCFLFGCSFSCVQHLDKTLLIHPGWF